MENYIGQIKEVRISGGLTRSEVFNQIQADVYGKPVVKPNYEETSSLGAAIIAATKIGLYNNIYEAVNYMCRVNSSSKKEPIDENTKTYADLAKIHDELYWSLEKAGIYRKLNEFTNFNSSQ